MEQEKYIKERVKDQIEWHSKKSTLYKRCFLGLSVISLVISVVVSATIKSDNHISFYLSLAIPVCTGLMAIFRFQEKWNIYRNTAESIKSEFYKFETKTGAYSTENSFNIFVEKIEIILNNNNQKWTDTQFNPK